MAEEKCARQVQGIVSALVGAIAWGFSGTCVQYLFSATALDPLVLTMLRQLGAGILFLLILLCRHRLRVTAMLHERTTRKRLIIFGSCGLFFNSSVYAIAISYTNAGTATVLQSLNIVFALAISCVVARRYPRRPEIAALGCALTATYLIATHGNPSTLHMPLAGLFFGIATAAAATFYTMYPKPLFERWGSFAVTGLGLLMGGITGLIVCMVTGKLAGGLPTFDGPGYAVLATAIIVGTFGAYGLFLHGVSIVGPVWGNMLGAAEPVSATLIAAFWLHTSFAWADWLGLLLMVITIVLVAGQTQSS